MMKAKSRPASPTVGNHFQGCSILNRKKKAHHHLEIDGKAAELMTASTGKRRLVCVSSSLAMPSLELVGGKGVKAAGHTKEFTDDACESLRLAFSTIDGPSVDLKVCVQATHPSILDTIFSPIHMPMGILGEGSSNCNHRGEHHQHLNEKMEMVENRQDDNNNACEEENNQATLASCLTLDVHRDASVTKLPIDATMTMQDTMANTRSLLDDELIGSQTTFDVTESSMVWPLLDENAAISHRHDTESFEEGLLNSDGACLFFAMQQTMSLECNDNTGNESRVPDEIDDFDPYLFIKSLPDLVEVVAPYRPILLTRQTRRWPPITLVLDLDETLVHSTLEHCDDADFTFPVHFNLKEHTVYVRCRPYLQVFMERVAQMFEVIVFTASQSIYAEQLLNMLDPKQKLIHHRVYRESCVFVEGNYMKDLTVLGRDLAKIAIIDNSPQAFGFQVDNGIPIESWFDDRSDCALLSLLPFLETLVGVDDVRPIIAKKFNLRLKISTITVEHPSLEHRGDLFSGHL